MVNIESDDLGQRIRSLRTERGWPQEYVSKELGVSRSAVSQIENGERQVSTDELRKLARLFSVTTDFLVGDENKVVVKLGEMPKSKKIKNEERISVPHAKVEKFKQVLLYVLNKCGAKPNVGETVIYKLLYFIDFNYYELYEEQLTGASYRKLQYGPVPREFNEIVAQMTKKNYIVKHAATYHGKPQTRYSAKVAADLNMLTAAEISVIDDVIDRLSDRSAKWISEYSHEDMPWSATEDNKVIDYELVFYRSPAYSVRDYDEEDDDL